MNQNPSELGFDRNEYLRPNEKWVCGGAADGTPCPLGPSSAGACGGACAPYRIKDRWHCGNASDLEGRCDDGPLEDGSCCQMPAQCVPAKRRGGYACTRGTCSHGPNPDGTCCQPYSACRPVRSLLARRRLFSLCAFALALGGGLMMIGGKNQHRWISPGGLSAKHAVNADKCSVCHQADSDGPSRSASPDGSDAVTSKTAQNAQCIKCHDQLGPFAEDPHSRDPAVLQKVSDQVRQRNTTSDATWLVRISRSALSVPEQLDCAICHHEHHGVYADLKHFADNRCQSCHVQAFESFSEGHPEFELYPYARRSGVYFDHESHYRGHFREANRLPPNANAGRFLSDGDTNTQSCSACHVTDVSGGKMLLRSFGKTCASCHEHQSQDDVLAGLPVFSVPAVDKTHDADRIGDWPTPRVPLGNSELLISPIMRYLFSANPEFAEADREISDFDLADLSDATQQQRHAAQRYVVSFKQQWAELVQGGQQEVEGRLRKLLDDAGDDQRITQLASLVQHRWLETAQRRWLENSSANVAIAGDDADEPRPDRGWYLNDADQTVYYRPTGHEDPMLVAWIELAACEAGSARQGSPLHALYQSLTHPAAVGRCMKCHTVEPTAGSGMRVNWNSLRHRAKSHSFVKFAHDPHLVMHKHGACKNCHVLKDPLASEQNWTIFRAEFIDSRGRIVPAGDAIHSNFKPVAKANCASCHRPNRASQSCSTCHNYHVPASDAAHCGR